MAVLVCSIFVSVVFAEEFPYRKDFPTVTYISSQDLKAKYDKNEVIVVDVRSKIEYDVSHIEKAVHIPIAYTTFIADVEKLIKESPKKPIVFYCNGTTCLKSYEAAKRLTEAGHKNSFVYDGGIPEWTKLYPKNTIVFGKELRDPEKQLISDAEFKKRLIDFETFKAKAAMPNTMVIDLREGIQSSGKLPGLENARNMPLDVIIPNFVLKKEGKDKTLLVFDQVGKQVKWLMYYLQEYGYKNYFFLDKGATEVLHKQEYK